MGSHSFSVAIAKDYGVDCAVLYNHYDYWVKANREKGLNLMGGRYWTYDTAKTLQAKFYYWEERKIYRLIDKLRSHKLIFTAQPKAKWGNHVTWVTTEEPTESDKSVVANDEGIVANDEGIVKSDDSYITVTTQLLPHKSPLPIINEKLTATDNTKHNLIPIKGPNKFITDEMIDNLWELTPRKSGKKASVRYMLASIKDDDTYDKAVQAIKNYNIMIKDSDPKYIKMGSTFWNNWEDEIYQEHQEEEKGQWDNYL